MNSKLVTGALSGLLLFVADPLKAEEQESVQPFSVDATVAFDGRVVGTGQVAIAPGQTEIIEDAEAGFRLSIKRPADIALRAHELYKIDLSTDASDHTLLETELFLKDRRGEWRTAFSHNALSHPGRKSEHAKLLTAGAFMAQVAALSVTVAPTEQ